MASNGRSLRIGVLLLISGCPVTCAVQTLWRGERSEISAGTVARAATMAKMCRYLRNHVAAAVKRWREGGGRNYAAAQIQNSIVIAFVFTLPWSGRVKRVSCA